MIFYTSDTHYGHRNVIAYSNRPFANIEEMDEVLVTNWNTVVKPQDTVFHLGDVSFSSRPRTKEIVQSLNGHKILIMGNHDLPRSVDFWHEAGFEEVHKLGYGKTYEAGPNLQLCHYPHRERMDEYDNRNHLKEHAPGGSVLSLSSTTLLHGHVHDKWKFKPGMINVGVDVWNYVPVTLERMLAQYEVYLKA